MNITCSQCDADVPEGSTACPKCKAGIGTVVLGKNKSLTKSLIAKAVEMRTSIPWATDSAVVMVDDGTGKSKPGAGAFIAIGVVVLLVVGGALAYFGVRSGEPQIELTAVEVAKGDAKAEAETKPAVAKVAPKAAPTVKTASASSTTASVSPKAATAAPAKKAGTLSVEAIYKGKAVPARVVVNGENKGNTPVSVALGPGKYTVKIEKTGFISAKLQDVQIDPGRNTALKIDLKK